MWWKIMWVECEKFLCIPFPFGLPEKVSIGELFVLLGKLVCNFENFSLTVVVQKIVLLHIKTFHHKFSIINNIQDLGNCCCNYFPSSWIYKCMYYSVVSQTILCSEELEFRPPLLKARSIQKSCHWAWICIYQKLSFGIGFNSLFI